MKILTRTIYFIFALLLSCVEMEDTSLVSTDTSSTVEVTDGSDATMQIASYNFTGAEGDPILESVAARWINNFETREGTTSCHFFSRRILLKLLSKDGSIGLRFYYSVDESEKSRLIVVASDANGENLRPLYGIAGGESNLSVTSSEPLNSLLTASDTLSYTKSKQWTGRYKARHPNGYYAHFFGAEILQQILAEKDCVGIRAYFALDDAGIQQLILVGVDVNGGNLTPSAAELLPGGETVMMADVSYPCPTYCASNETSL